MEEITVPVPVVAQEVVTPVLLEEAKGPAALVEEIPTVVLVATGQTKGRQARKRK